MAHASRAARAGGRQVRGSGPDQVTLRRFGVWPDPSGSKPLRREVLRFLIGFSFDDSVIKRDEDQLGECVRDVATEVLAGQVKVGVVCGWNLGPLSWAFTRAVVMKFAAEELARLKN